MRRDEHDEKGEEREINVLIHQGEDGLGERSREGKRKKRKKEKSPRKHERLGFPSLIS